MQTHETLTIDTTIRQEIEARLTRLASEEGVRLLMAIESGSRAWGFPSPDSDYDIRFIYVRPRSEYLSLMPVRDVIERPIVDEIDLNGWDIRKALGLMLKNNSVLSEWIESPVHYIQQHPAVTRIAELEDRYFNPRSYALHYANQGKSAAERWLHSGGAIAVKRYFYALRPALAIRVLRINSTRRPPMQLQSLMHRAELSEKLCNEIEQLVTLKAETREAGLVSRVPEMDTLISDELNRAMDVPERPISEEFRSKANQLFLALVEQQ